MKPAWISIAEHEIGVREIPGITHNIRVLEYHKVTTLKATTDEVPWCSSFACWCMEQIFIKSPRSARARDWLHWGEVLEKPVYGCVVILDRNGQGHVGFYVGETDTSIEILGGNQGNQVCTMKFSKDRVLGYRAPEGWIEANWHPPLVYARRV